MSIMQLTQTIQIMPQIQARRSKQTIQQTLPGMEAEPAAPAKVTNRQIAEVLSSIADLLETQRSNPYRIQAYRNAARGVLDLLEPVADILARGEKLPITGLGPRLRTRIAELVQGGSMTFQNGFCLETLPRGVRILMTLEHIGPYTAIRLYEELGISSVEQLWLAAQQHRIRALAGFGTKSESRLKISAEHILQEKNPHALGGAA